MIRYCLKRIGMAVPVLLGITLLAFVLGILAPGDPAEMALNQNGLDSPSDSQIAAMRQQLGLDRPWFIQYGAWLGNVLRGDLGVSYITGIPVVQEFKLRLPVTLELAFAALLLAGTLGIMSGCLAALHKEERLDRTIRWISNILLAVPGFWLALMAIMVFSEWLQILPTSGIGSWRSFVLPASVLALPTVATIGRYTRNALINEFAQPYCQVARMRGIPPMRLLFRYALPNALVPIVALLGNYFAMVLGGSVVIESIFAIPGISSLAMQAISQRDYIVIQGYVLLCGTLLVTVMVLVDILIAYINPRVKLEGRR